MRRCASPIVTSHSAAEFQMALASSTYALSLTELFEEGVEVGVIWLEDAEGIMLEAAPEAFVGGGGGGEGDSPLDDEEEADLSIVDLATRVDEDVGEGLLAVGERLAMKWSRRRPRMVGWMMVCWYLKR